MTDYEHFDVNQEYRRGNLGLGLLLLFIGMGVGAATALMLAPKTGREMRKQLRRQYEDARDWIGDMSDQAGELLEKGSNLASTAKDRIRPIVQPIAKAARRI